MKATWIIAMTMLLCGISYALTCVSNNAPEMNEWYLVSCSAATANSSCFVQVSRTNDSRIVDYQPETAFNIYDEGAWATADGFVVIPVRIKPDIYFEGENYTINTTCGAATESKTFVVGSYQNPTQMTGSFVKWFSENTPILMMAGIGLVVGGVILMAGLYVVMGR